MPLAQKIAGNMTPGKTMTETALATEPGTDQYSIQRVRSNSAGEPLLTDWKAFAAGSASEPMMHNPDWLQGYFAGQLEKLSAYFVYQSGSLQGVAPFLSRDWPLKWHLGELTAAQFPLRRLRLLGATPGIPEDASAYDLLFTELAKQKNAFDAIYLEGVPLDSFLWNYLKTSTLVHEHFRAYFPDLPLPHLQLRFRGSFSDYMKKFSPKQRKNLLRQVTKIREGIVGEMRFEQYTRPDQVPLFLEPAVEISKKTYQWKLHHRGLSATELLRQRLLFAAENSWMRCYLLFCGGTPCAFLVGYQCGSRFVIDEIGFDPTLSKFSPGTSLHLMVIEDLFNRNRPEVYDLGVYNRYKEVLSTESYLESNVFLFRPGAYLRLVQEGHRACQLATKTISAFMDGLRLKSALKKIIRAQNSSS